MSEIPSKNHSKIRDFLNKEAGNWNAIFRIVDLNAFESGGRIGPSHTDLWRDSWEASEHRTQQGTKTEGPQ